MKRLLLTLVGCLVVAPSTAMETCEPGYPDLPPLPPENQLILDAPLEGLPAVPAVGAIPELPNERLELETAAGRVQTPSVIDLVGEEPGPSGLQEMAAAAMQAEQWPSQEILDKQGSLEEKLQWIGAGPPDMETRLTGLIRLAENEWQNLSGGNVYFKNGGIYKHQEFKHLGSRRGAYLEEPGYKAFTVTRHAEKYGYYLSEFGLYKYDFRARLGYSYSVSGFSKSSPLGSYILGRWDP